MMREGADYYNTESPTDFITQADRDEFDQMVLS